jgi:hypothetical protein
MCDRRDRQGSKRGCRERSSGAARSVRRGNRASIATSGSIDCARRSPSIRLARGGSDDDPLGCYVTKAKAAPKPAATMIVNTKSSNCQRGGRAFQLFGLCGFMARPFAALFPAREDQRGWRNMIKSLLI